MEIPKAKVVLRRQMSLEEIEKLVEPLWDKRPVFKSIDVGPGWYPLIADIIDEAQKHGIHFTISQIKEKFGVLKFYAGEISDQVGAFYDIVQIVEKRSVTICEKCGMPGQKRNTGWIRTLCEKCNLAYLA